MDRSKMKLSKYRCFLLCLSLILAIITPITAFAEESEKKVVRVGLVGDNYNKISDDGEISGYEYEYLQKIAGYNGWTYKYVSVDWSDCFTKLQNGELDIIGGISYTEERAENMLFSELPMSEERYYIFDDMSDTEVSASDMDSFEGKTIGVFENSIPEMVLNEWEKKNNLHTQHVNISTADDVVGNLKNHKMDCFVSMEERRNEKSGEADVLPILNIGNADAYFAINKDRSDLKEELDSAMRRITNDNPFYTDELYKQYLSAERASVLTSEEKIWLKKHDTIRIGYISGDAGISSLDPESGKLTGVISDYIEYAGNCINNQKLNFETKGFDSLDEELEALKNEEIDMIFEVSQNPYYEEQNALSLSDTVMKIPLVAITSQKDFQENAEKSVAIIKGAQVQEWYLNYRYPDWKIVKCDSFEDAEKMVRDGKVDCMLTRSGRAQKYLRDPKFHAVLLENDADISFAVKRENKTLLSILNKTLQPMQSDMLTNALSIYENTMQKVTTADFVNDNKSEVLVFIAILLLFISVVFVLLKKSRMAEEKANKAMRVAEDANMAKSNFLFNMSHDIRTPMNAILGFAELAGKNMDNQQRLDDYLKKIQVSGKGLLLMLDKVLEISRIEAGKTVLEESPQECEKVLDSCMVMMNPEIEKKHLTVILEKQIQNPYTYFDAARITEIILNILSNAIKYTADGGKIDCIMSQSSHPDAGWIYQEFSIRDTGIGMSEEFQKRIFDLFARERSTTSSGIPGTGLGMGITKKLVDLMDGTITVKSKVGEGTTVTVKIPMRIASFEDTQPKHANMFAGRERLQGKHILLAEDNDLNAEIAITLLEEEGLQIDRAKDGVECVKKLEYSKPGYYELILMDIQMPSMNGYEATEKIRKLDDKKKAKIPIIAMTANAFSEDKTRAAEVGMNDHVAKPVDMDILITTMLKYL